MRSVIVAAFVAFALTLFGTPIAIKYFNRLNVGQPIRELGPAHQGKRGTPTMGGVVFILATVIAYAAGHLVLLGLEETPTRRHGPTVTGMVLLGLFVCCGLVGFIDDFLKVRKRNSLGLNEKGKLIGQLIVGVLFGIIALFFPNDQGVTLGSEYISFVRDVDWLFIGKVGAVILFAFVVISASNGVNLTDGLDGLATGSSMMVLTAYTVIGFWQYRHVCGDSPTGDLYCYEVRDPLEIALIAGAAVGALFGFLWWNASPAKIFMGDSGALGLGGLIGGMAMATKTILLLPILGTLFVIITMSLIIQRISYKSTGRRVFRMAPLHHHFELVGWSEVNIVIRFWIICGIGVAIGLGFFYADFLAVIGQG
ncbi:MAG: phospho-N-acetylmuramoyl-pentapeptide-transferase [Micromonosporaceae bacterium]